MTLPTIAPKTARRIRRVAQATSLLTMAVVFLGTSAAHALSNKQVRAFDRGAYYYNTEVCGGNGDKGTQKTIVIDPGHSGKSITTQDESGLKDFDYPNPSEAKPLENEEMMYVALNLKKKLASDGYRVVLTKGNDLDVDDAKTVRSDAVKKGARESVSLRERAEIANAQNADLAISLHDDHGQQWDWAELYTQKVGLYREGTKGKVEFTDKAVATESQRIGKIFVTERGKAEKHTVKDTDANFGGREGLDGGNIPQVMLYAQVPWVYNEVGAAPVGQHLSQEHLDQYVAGNYEAIKKALPVVAGGTTNLAGKDNIEKSFNYFVSKGLSDLQAAAIIGNLMVEGGVKMDPKQVEIKGDGITRADKPIRNRGYGIAQWTFPSRQEGLEAMAAKQNKGPGDLGVQLDWLWKELNTSYKGALEDLRKQKDIAKAVESFQNKFENPADKQGSLGRRTDYAKAALKAYGSGNEGGTLTAEDDTTGTATCTGGGDAAINCDDPTLTTSDMSNTRKNVVCLAKQELKRWKDGELKPPGTDFQKYMVKEDGKKGKQVHAWCSEFASWIYYKAGYPFHGGIDGGWRIPLVRDVARMGNKNDKFESHGAKGYTPKPGDLAIYQGGGSNLPTSSKIDGDIIYAHISIVTEVKGNEITIIGGNQSGNGGPTTSRVSQNKLTRASNGGYSSWGQTVIGFVTPKD